MADHHPHLVATAIALSLLASVVGGPSVWAALRDKHTDGRWELLAGSHGVTAGLVIEIDDDEITGRGPCNDFRADWSQDVGASDLSSTAMGCGPSILREETTYLDLLANAETVEVEDDELRVTHDDQTLVLARLG